MPMLIPIGVLIGWIITIFTLWRGMKALESLAKSLRMIAENQKQA